MTNDRKNFFIAIIISLILHVAIYNIITSINFNSQTTEKHIEFNVSYIQKKKAKIKSKVSSNEKNDDSLIRKPRIKKETLPDPITLDPDSVQTPTEPIENALKSEPAKDIPKVENTDKEHIDEENTEDDLPSVEDSSEDSLNDSSDVQEESELSNNTSEIQESEKDKKDDNEKQPIIKAGDNSLYILPLSETEVNTDQAIKSFEDDHGKLSEEDRKKAILIQFKVEIGESGNPQIRDFISMTNNPEIDDTIKAMVSLMSFEKEREAYLPILIFTEKKTQNKGVIQIQRKGDFKAKTIEIPKIE